MLSMLCHKVTNKCNTRSLLYHFSALSVCLMSKNNKAIGDISIAPDMFEYNFCGIIIFSSKTSHLAILSLLLGRFFATTPPLPLVFNRVKDCYLPILHCHTFSREAFISNSINLSMHTNQTESQIFQRRNDSVFLSDNN